MIKRHWRYATWMSASVAHDDWRALTIVFGPPMVVPLIIRRLPPPCAYCRVFNQPMPQRHHGKAPYMTIVLIAG